MCSECLDANLPHSLPVLRCSGCEIVIPRGSSYYRAPPVGDSHADVCLCEKCFSGLFAEEREGGVSREEVRWRRLWAAPLGLPSGRRLSPPSRA